MKTTLPSQRRSAKRHASFEARIAAYTAVAGAACLAAPDLGATPQAITFSSAPTWTNHGEVTFNVGSFQPMRLDGQSTRSSSSYGPRTTYRAGIYSPDSHLLAFATVGADRLAQPAFGKQFASLTGGVHAWSSIGRLVTNANGNLFGNFKGAHKTGYIAFKGVANAQNYYGWLKVQVGFDGQNRPQTVTLVPISGNVYGAYDLASSVVADGFAVGSLATPIPEPASVAVGLGLFALGAVGVRELRRRRKQPAA